MMYRFNNLATRSTRTMLLVGAAAGLLASCAGSDDLSRNEAAELVAQHPKLASSASVRIFGYERPTCDEISQSDDTPMVRGVIRARLADLRMRDDGRYCTLHATEDGRRLVATMTNGQFAAPYFTHRIDSVTGITKDATLGLTLAKFSYSTKELEWWSRVIPDSIRRRFAIPPAGTGEAMLRRYDDGWRVEDVVLRRLR